MAEVDAVVEKERNLLDDFIDRYGPPAGEGGPVLFVREVLGVEPDPWQEDVLRDFGRKERRISIRSCHGPGKTAVAAWIIVLQLLTRFPQKTACTAPTGGQLFDALFAETVSWMDELPPVLRGMFTVKSDSISLNATPKKSFLTARTARAEQPEALQGIHSDWVLLVVDEASGVHEAIFEAAAGSMSGNNATTLLLSNPVRTSGFFFDTHHKLKDMWRTYHISHEQSPRVTDDFVEDIRRRYGEESNAFRIRALGEFPLSDLDTVIPYALVVAAQERDIVVTELAPVVWGLDVARFGDDLTALVKRKRNVVTEPPQRWQGLDTMRVVGVVKAEWDSTSPLERPVEILVDVIGIGAGVCDRLRELGLPARGVNVSESPAMKGHYVRLRDELWFETKQWFARRDSSIPDDEDFIQELVTPKFEIIDSNGRIKVESKKQMKKRGYKSPNLADAFVLTFASTAATGLHGGGTSWKKPIRRRVKGIV